jgi:hypothetical protein
VDVPPHELIERVEQETELQVRVVVLLIRLKDLYVEEDDTGEEGLVADLR